MNLLFILKHHLSIYYFHIYNLNFNSNLVKLINLSKLFTNVYKSLLSFILLIIILNQYLYVKYFLFYLLLIIQNTYLFHLHLNLQFHLIILML